MLARRGDAFALLLVAALALVACAADEDFWSSDGWDITVTSTEQVVTLSATIANAHGDYVHMSIRREGHDNGYTVERSPAPNQPRRDWSRVHHFFGELQRDTYLEGRIDDGSGKGPSGFRTFTFDLPRAFDSPRLDFPDVHGSDYVYITSVYSYADGNRRHPTFPPGVYEVEIYPWYTGRANDKHPAVDGRPEVQYIHYEHPLAAATFVLE